MVLSSGVVRAERSVKSMIVSAQGQNPILDAEHAPYIDQHRGPVTKTPPHQYIPIKRLL